MWWLIVVMVWSGLAWGANTHGVPDVARERQFWWGEYATTGYVVEGCIHGLSPTASAVVSGCRGYVRRSGGMEYVVETSRTLEYTDGDGTYWVVMHARVGDVVGGWTRVVGTHYVWQQSSTQPVLPDGAEWLMRVVVSGGAVTVVGDWRRSSPRRDRRVTDGIYAADASGASDSLAAFTAAIEAAEEQGGDTVRVPVGIYALSGRVRVGTHIRLVCERGAILRASASNVNEMLYVQGASSTIARGTVIEGCLLDGANLAQWAIGLDAANQWIVKGNMVTSFPGGFIRTNFTRNGNADSGKITENHVYNETAFGFAGGVDTPIFLQAIAANGSTVDQTMVSDNQHIGVGSWSIILQQSQRITVSNHIAANNDDTEPWQGAILITNPGGNSVSRNIGKHYVENLTLENSNAYDTPVGVKIDCDYSQSGPAGQLEHIKIVHVRTGQEGLTPNYMVDLQNTGSNCSLQHTYISQPRKDTDQDNRIRVGANVEWTAIDWAGTDARLGDLIEIDPAAVGTVINNIRAFQPGDVTVGANPLPTEGDRGTITFNPDDGRWWGMEMVGSPPTLTQQLIGGPVIEYLTGWLTVAAPSASLGRLRAHTFLLRAYVHTTEAWDSDGSDELDCNNGFSIVFDGADADVSSLGVVVPPLGNRAGYDANNTVYNCAYTAGGSSPTTGKSLVVLEFLQVPPQP